MQLATKHESANMSENHHKQNLCVPLKYANTSYVLNAPSMSKGLICGYVYS